MKPPSYVIIIISTTTSYIVKLLNRESALQLWMEDCGLHKLQRHSYNTEGTM